MPIVTNPLLRDLAVKARKEWDREPRQHDVEYRMDVGRWRLVGWTISSAQNAMLNTMSMQVIGGDIVCTYLQVRRSGLAVRALTRLAGALDLQRWYRVYPEDRKAFQKLLGTNVKVAA